MGFDGIYRVYHRNEKTNEYEKLAFYDKEGKELGNPFPSRDGMLNQLLLDYNRHGYNFEPIAYRRGVPEWYVEKLKVEEPEWFDENCGWTYNADEGTYYDYLELRGWAQGNACEYADYFDEDCYDENEEEPRDALKRNPLKEFMAIVDTYLDAYNIWNPKPGDVYIIAEMSY